MINQLQLDELKYMKKLNSRLSLLSILVLILSACSQDKSPDQNSSDAEWLTGMFLDSPVEGLTYKTGSRTGKTNQAGEFKYRKGERIAFSIGDIELGEVEGKGVITPLTLVPDAVNETHPKVTNIVRLLITLDDNQNPDDGITITTETDEAAKGLRIDFGTADLSIHPDIVKLLARVANTPVLVEATAAQEHFSESLIAQSSWGSMIWGSGTWQDTDHFDQQSIWGLMQWGASAWQQTNTNQSANQLPNTNL